MSTLITGGAGYIGGHAVHELVASGESVIAVDDLSAKCRVGWSPIAPLFIGDCGDEAFIRPLIDKHQVSAIIHLAGSSTVPEHERDGASHHRRTAAATRILAEVAIKCGVRHFVFGSTAAVYGDPGGLQLSEDSPALPLSPYGLSMLTSEKVLRDIAGPHDLHYVILRIFSVAGIDPKRRRGLAGGHTDCILTAAIEAALGRRANIEVYGTSYRTPDGTYVRDYIHVGDAAGALIAALAYLRAGGPDATLDCGSGRGHSVRDVINAVERVGGRLVPVRCLEPKPDEPAIVVADSRRTRSVLAWTPRFDDLDTIATHALVGELRRMNRPNAGAGAFLTLVAESGVAPTELRKIISAFREPSRPTVASENATAAPSSPVAGPRSPSQPTRGAKALTIGMATYDDYDGVYFTLQGIRLYHPEVLSDVEFVVVDNNPGGPCGPALNDLGNSIDTYRYVPKGGMSGTAIRDWVFQEARGDFVLCIDCHFLIASGALERLIAYSKAVPQTRDLLQGPMIHDNLKDYSTHFNPEWRAGMYGTWDTDPAGADADQPPFEIPMQGLGLFACRRTAWPGFNPRFHGFGGEEGYLHEKFRRLGGKVLCLPFLRWMHRFNRPLGTRYPVLWEDRVRNYLVGFRELGWDTRPVVDHFEAFLGEQVWSMLVERLGPDLACSEPGRPVEPGASEYDHVKKADGVPLSRAARR